MCGICGICNSKNPISDVRRMMEAIRHRGPDAGGSYIDESSPVAFGHRRLSILDLSEAGEQPMISQDKRYVLVFNGEIYNYQELRTELPEGVRKRLKSKTDSEILLEFLAAKGPEGALRQIRGMFAAALYDRQEKAVYLIRDRAGEKPLYYGFAGHMFVFASELKAIQEVAFRNGIRLTVDRDAVGMYLRHSYIPAPYSIYKEIKKVEAACIVKVRFPFAQTKEPVRYWKLEEQIRKRDISRESAKQELSELLSDAVREQTVADVPYGAFLSGGIDSSLIVAYMKKVSGISNKSVKTFSIGFGKEAYNEAPFAKKVASYLGCDHEELYLTDREAMQMVPQIGRIYDEPYADSSQIPAYFVSKLAKEKVSVVLTGDAGDELFSGYEHYPIIAGRYEKIRKVPGKARRAVGEILGSRIFGPANQRTFNNKIDRLSRVLRASDFAELYYEMLLVYTSKNPLMKCVVPKGYFTGYAKQLPYGDPVSSMQFLDFHTYLTNDILVKVDRAAMGNSLETRIPFLDKRIIEFAYSLPPELKCGHLGSKMLLRELLYDEVPRELLERPKKGFAIPLDDWLRGGVLREWAEQMVYAEELKALQGFDHDQAVSIWKRHAANKGNYKSILWNIILLSQWLQQNRKYYKT